VRKSRFDNVIVIGCGKIVGTVLKYVAGLRDSYGFALCYIQYETQGMTAVHKICEENNIEELVLPDKKDVTQKLLTQEKKTLIISAGNYYIFPKELLGKENIVVINFHNALLPKFPGRNAPSWAIYYGEEESGATWHEVTVDVDAGGIIWQGKCHITPDMKAYELTARIMELAQQGIETFLEQLLGEDIETIKQEQTENRVMFYAKDIPAGGCLSVTDSAEHIYRTLRAIDYGKAGPFPPLKLQLTDGKSVEVTRYKKVPKSEYNEAEPTDNYIGLDYDDEAVLLLKYKIKEN